VSGFLAPYKKRLEQVAVESTYNWYWLVDGLRALKYPVVLANPAAMEQYSGIKHAFEPSGVIGGCRAPFNGELLGKTICGGFDRAASQ
jgi:hypothetical protein